MEAPADRPIPSDVLGHAIERAIELGAPRGSMTLAKLAEAYASEKRLAPQLADGLRLTLAAIEKGEKLDADILAVMHALLARWETR